MENNINLILSWKDFSFSLAAVIFFFYIIVDGLYAYYTLSVTALKPFRAATSGFIIHFILAFGVISYVGNFLYVIPLAIGSWIGTYLTVKMEKEWKGNKKASA